MANSKARLLIFIVAYHAESTIAQVLTRIPQSLLAQYEVEVLVIDDASSDRTFDIGIEFAKEQRLPFPLRVLFNPINQGYGGNQKLGYHYAIEQNFDYVALLHGDGQYAPELLPQLVEPLYRKEVDAVFGSRMMITGAALKGGMPLYKYLGNKFLTWYENTMLQTKFTEFHSGYRVYSVDALQEIPFDRNSNDFHFDTEIIIQFVYRQLRIKELAIPTYYGDEICRVNGLHYAFQVVRAVTIARLQKLGLLYDPKFDFIKDHHQYQDKSYFISPHALCLDVIRPNSTVLDMGCAGGYVGDSLTRKLGCRVTGIDAYPPDSKNQLDRFILHDFNQSLPPIALKNFDYILLLDVIEHLNRPEEFVRLLYSQVCTSPNQTIIVSTGNIAFIVQRLMLLLGQFNYGKCGILDSTHTRLFTFASFRRLFEQAGFEVQSVSGIPAPVPLAIGHNVMSRFFLRLNQFLIKISKGLFAYQMIFLIKPKPSVAFLLDQSLQHSAKRTQDQMESLND
jgi:glycosyltransferase involved in cell wall biosynthesis